MTADRQIFVDAKIRYACAEELGVANERLVFTMLDTIGDYVHFQYGEARFTARLNKSGRAIKKNSVRADRT